MAASAELSRGSDLESVVVRLARFFWTSLSPGTFADHVLHALVLPEAQPGRFPAPASERPESGNGVERFLWLTFPGSVSDRYRCFPSAR